MAIEAVEEADQDECDGDIVSTVTYNVGMGKYIAGRLAEDFCGILVGKP